LKHLARKIFFSFLRIAITAATLVARKHYKDYESAAIFLFLFLFHIPHSSSFFFFFFFLFFFFFSRRRSERHHEVSLG